MTPMRGMDIGTVAAAAALALGVGLMGFMVVVEGEPGLLPLLLVISGGIGLVVARRRARRR